MSQERQKSGLVYSGDYDLVVNRHISIHLSLVDSIQVWT